MLLRCEKNAAAQALMVEGKIGQAAHGLFRSLIKDYCGFLVVGTAVDQSVNLRIGGVEVT